MKLQKDPDELIKDAIKSFFGSITKRIEKFNPRKNNGLSDESKKIIDNRIKTPDEVKQEFKSFLNSLKNKDDIFSGKFKKLNNGTPEGEYLYWTYTQYKSASEFYRKNHNKIKDEQWLDNARSEAKTRLDVFVKEMYKTFQPENKEYYKDEYFCKEFEKYFPKGTKKKPSIKNGSQFKLDDKDISFSVDPVSLKFQARVKGQNKVLTGTLNSNDFVAFSKGKISSASLVESYCHEELSKGILKNQFKPYLDSLKDKNDLLSGDMNLLPRGTLYFEYQKYRSLRDEMGRWNKDNSDLGVSKKNMTVEALNNFIGNMRDTLSPLVPEAQWNANSEFHQNEMNLINTPRNYNTCEQSINDGSKQSVAHVKSQSYSNKVSHGIKR